MVKAGKPITKRDGAVAHRLRSKKAKSAVKKTAKKTRKKAKKRK